MISKYAGLARLKTNRAAVTTNIGMATSNRFLMGFWSKCSLGSPEKVEILGYEGTDNVGNMARMSDAIMYLVYILTASTVAALVWGVIYTKVKK